MTSPRLVDFEHVFKDEQSARSFLGAVRATVDEVRLYAPEPESDAPWEVQCRRRMVPTHAEISRTESELAELAVRFGGRADGWGTLSNPDGSPAD